MSSKNPQVYPPSVQNHLFAYLKPEQKRAIRPILRQLKKRAQVELCIALQDYLETGIVWLPEDLTLASLFIYLTRATGSMPDDPHDKSIIRPLHTDRAESNRSTPNV